MFGEIGMIVIVSILIPVFGILTSIYWVNKLYYIESRSAVIKYATILTTLFILWNHRTISISKIMENDYQMPVLILIPFLIIPIFYFLSRRYIHQVDNQNIAQQSGIYRGGHGENRTK